MMAATLLASQGVGIHLIDKQWAATSRGQSVILHPQSLALLEQIGLAQQVLRSSACVERIIFYEGNQCHCELNLSVLPVAHPYATVIRQDVLEHLLAMKLRENGIAVDWAHALSTVAQSENCVTAGIEKWGRESRGYAIATAEPVLEQILDESADFVIGADGYDSATRRSMGLATLSAAQPQFFAVFEFRSDFEFEREARVQIGPVGAEQGQTDLDVCAALWPLPDGWHRWCFRIDAERVSQPARRQRLAVQIGSEFYPHVDREELERLIDRYVPWFTSRITQIRWSMLVRFEQSMAAEFGRQRCWLAGDAAHLAGPVAGHSLNSGLLETQDLCQAIVKILRQGQSLQLLDEYNRLHTGRWRTILGLEKPVIDHSRASSWVKQHATHILACIPALGQDQAALACQVGLELSV